MSFPSALNTYTDFSSFAGLRADARERSPEAVKEVARQFEALFLQMMLKSMRAATPGDPIFGGDQGKLYRDLFDQQISLQMSAGKGIGLSKVLERQLQDASGIRVPAEVDVNGIPAPLSVPKSATLAGQTGHHSALFATPKSFVNAVLPHAERAAQKIGIEAGVLVAQAALETGWGKAMIHNAEGQPSYNFFGIKADSRWQGDRVGVPTVEYEQGVFTKTRGQFRAYESIAQGFDDYARFILDSSRYQPVAAGAKDGTTYLNGLQQAGYATDPAYGTKILALMQTEPMVGIKHSRQGPLN